MSNKISANVYGSLNRVNHETIYPAVLISFEESNFYVSDQNKLSPFSFTVR